MLQVESFSILLESRFQLLRLFIVLLNAKNIAVFLPLRQVSKH